MLTWHGLVLAAVLICVFQAGQAGGKNAAANKLADKLDKDRNNWQLKQANHKAKLLSSRKLTSVAGLTNIERMFRDELEALLIERVAGTPGAAQARQHITNRLNTIGGWTVEEDRFTDITPHGNKEFVNVIATYNPNVARRLVLACHYDSKYFAPRQDGRVFIGATDSAVPCAMMLDLAYTLNTILKSSTNEMVTLQLIFFDGEEAFQRWTSTDSIYGSRHLAEKWQQTPYGSATELDRIDMFVLLDLIGVANPRFHNHFPSQTGRWFQHMQNIESRLKSGGLLQSHNSQYFTRGQTGRIEDDHIPFLQRGVACFHIIPSPFPSVWHRVDDDATALDKPTIDDLNKMLQIFTTEYLHLKITA